ncbi:MAG: CapA family protein [Deltaproteobacteria bacterium]|nr:MAG: CapA family protein [Deltaproteobacteria bacterium]
MRLPPLFLIGLAGCGFARWPDPSEVYPAVYTPEEDLEPYEEVRWETGTWDPTEDLDIAAQYLLKSNNHRPGAPVESLDHFEAMRPQLPPLAGGVELSLVGDVMWIGENWSGFLTPAADLLDGDLRIGNLETPTSALHPVETVLQGLPAFNAPPEMLDGLPLDVLQLNNNHSLDVGEDGLTSTLEEVDARGYVRTGIDRHAFVEVDGQRIALLAYAWGLNQLDVTPERELFLVPFGHLDPPVDLSSVRAEIAAAREDADSVVVLLHWGFEYEYYPDPHFMVLARELVAAGADVLVGSGPHVVQPPELCHVNRAEHVPGIGTCSVRSDDGEPRTAAVLYSLGNFGTRMARLPAQVGLVASVSLDPDVTGLGWQAAATVDGANGLEVVPLDGLTDEPDYAEEAERLDAHLGAHWRR